MRHRFTIDYSHINYLNISKLVASKKGAMAKSNFTNDRSIDERVLMAIVRVAERFKKESAALF